MKQYKIYCTEEQTKKALELGAPIEVLYTKDDYQQKIPIISIKGEFVNYDYFVPTAEEMIGWIEEQLKQKQYDTFDVTIAIEYSYDKDWGYFFGIEHFFNFNSRKEATIAAIDAALEYLKKNKTN